MNFTSEISLKIRTAIKVKLAELGNDVYEELPDYIMVMVANRRGQDQMTQDLSLFLGANTQKFTSWLHSLLSKLQSLASVSSEEKGASGNGNSGEDDNSKAQIPEEESDHKSDREDDNHSDHGSERDNDNRSDRESEHSNDEQSSSALPSGDDATKTELHPKQKEEEEEEQSESDSSLQKSDSRSEENSNSASHASNNEPSVTLTLTGDSDSNKPQNQTESVSVTENGNSELVVKKRKKHSTRVFRVKSRKLESGGDSNKTDTSAVSSSKLTDKQGSDGSDSENETRSYTLTQIRKMKENSVPVSPVSSPLLKTQQPEEKSVDESRETNTEQTQDQGEDNDIDKDDKDSDISLQQ